MSGVRSSTYPPLVVELAERRREPLLVTGLALDVVSQTTRPDPLADPSELGAERVDVVLGAVRA